MLGLTPAKLLIVFIVIVVVLGPHRLPEVARQLGRSWQRLRELHQRVDQELHRNVPNLPSSQDLARMARSPVTLLNELAAMPSADPAAARPDAPRPDPGAPAAPARPSPSASPSPSAPSALPLQPSDDPGMN
jgi:sec-independent protein translocase protein TatB